MSLGGVVIGRGEDLAGDVASKVGDFLGSLVDEQGPDDAVVVVAFDGGGHLLEEDGFAGLGGRDDHAALAVPDGAEQIDEAA